MDSVLTQSDWRSRLRYFRLRKGEKFGFTGWQREATNDPEQIAQWRDAGYDLGIACGVESNLFVLDIDSEEAHQLLRQIERNANVSFPPTFRVNTSVQAGFQRYQLYFQHPKQTATLGSPTNLNKCKLDCRGNGTLVVAFGARNISNHQYEAVNSYPPAEVPAQIILELEKLQSKKSASPTPESEQEIKEGERNDVLFKLACSLHAKKLSNEAIKAAVSVENRTRCKTPLPSSEIDAIVVSAVSYTPTEAKQQTKPKRKLFTVGPSSLADVEDEKTNWLWPNVIVAGDLNLFVGDPDIGKTFMTIAAIARLTTGGPFPFSEKKFEPSKVIVWCNEDSFGGKWKPRSIVAGVDLSKFIPRRGIGTSPDDNESYNLRLDQQEHREALRDFIVENPEVKLVVIDPLSSFIGECDLYKPTIRNITDPLTNIARETGVALLVIHHTNKRPAESAIKAAAGNQQLIAAVPNGWFFSKHDDVPGEFLMLQIRNKAGIKRGFRYRIVSRKWPEGFTPEDPEEAKDGVGLIEFVSKTKITADEILQRKQDKDESEVSRVRRAIAELLKDGQPMSNAECLKTLRAFGYSDNAINKAATQVGVDRNKQAGTWTLRPEANEKPRPLENKKLNFGEEPK